MARKPDRADSQAALAHPEDRRDVSRRARAEVEFEEQAVLGALFGEFDANLVLLENRLGVYIGARGNKIVVEGSGDDVARARDVLKAMHQRLLTGQELDSGAIEALIAMSGEPTLEGIITGDAKVPPIMIRTRRKTIVPRSAMQGEYMRQLASRDIIFALGPAGTGKTYVAVARHGDQRLDCAAVDFLPGQQPLVHRLEHVAGAGDVVAAAFDHDLVAAGADVDAEAVFEEHEVGVELAEQRAEHGLLLEFHFGPGPAADVATVLGVGQRRLAVGAIGFTGHALLSCNRR